MATPHALTRRDFLRYAGISTAALLLGVPDPWAFARTRRGAEPDTWIELKAAARSLALHPGAATRVWSYQARVLAGQPTCVQTWPGAYLGPILHLRRGQTVRVDFINH
ncbi:MAG TPA: twin-arginine translocation signal domain-containing protein, partial [Rhodanobacteraceae bacterium]